MPAAWTRCVYVRLKKKAVVMNEIIELCKSLRVGAEKLAHLTKSEGVYANQGTH